MGRSFWMIISIATMVTISLSLVALFIIVPQMVPVTETVKQYEELTKTEYTYTPSKNIAEEPEVDQHIVTPENINEGKASKQYKAGKINPFASSNTTTTSGTGTATNSTGTSGSVTAGTSTSGGTTQQQQPVSASDK